HQDHRHVPQTPQTALRPAVGAAHAVAAHRCPFGRGASTAARPARWESLLRRAGGRDRRELCRVRAALPVFGSHYRLAATAARNRPPAVPVSWRATVVAGYFE